MNTPITHSLIYIGSKFGKLTIIGLPTIYKKIGFLRHNILCKCDCGNDFSVMGGKLLSGVQTSCGCDDQFQYKPNAETFDKCLKLSKILNCNLGIAKVYLELGLTIEESIERYHPFENGHRNSQYYHINSFKEVGSILSHFILEEKDVFYTQVGEITDRYDRLRCACGTSINIRRSSTTQYLPLCRCDIFHRDYHNIKKSARFKMSKLPVVKMIPNDDDDIECNIEFDRANCVFGKTNNKMCKHYLGDSGCLSSLADNTLPDRFKPKFICYNPIEIKNELRLQLYTDRF